MQETTEPGKGNASTMPEHTDVDKSLFKDGAAEIASSDDQTQTSETEEKPTSTKKSFGFYAIIVALALTSLLTSLEATITSTALPTIVADLGGGFLFTWVVQGYYLTQ